MNKPHKHAALIKAWADGAEIQCRKAAFCDWADLVQGNPSWMSDWEYRIKPNMIKYRTYLYNSYGKPIVQTYNHGDSVNPEEQQKFIKWVGDWQEVEI